MNIKVPAKYIDPNDIKIEILSKIMTILILFFVVFVFVFGELCIRDIINGINKEKQ